MVAVVWVFPFVSRLAYTRAQGDMAACSRARVRPPRAAAAAPPAAKVSSSV